MSPPDITSPQSPSLDSTPPDDLSHGKAEEGQSQRTTQTPTPEVDSAERESIRRRFQLFQGIKHNLRRRAPFYWSDWTDAWNYRVIPASANIYFLNILPALAFSLEMFDRTDQSYGVNEVLLAAVIGSVIFSFFATQPLPILAITGPITVFNYTVYDIVTPRGTPYLPFMCWVGIWSGIMQWILAITNACNALTYVTRFSCDTFSFFVAVVYLEKGIQFLVRQWALAGETSAYLSIVVALLTFMSGWICLQTSRGTLFQRHIRKVIEDYGTPLTIVFFSGFVHLGFMREIHLETLPISRAFFPTLDRPWLVRFWEISVGDVFLAFPFAMLLTILLFFDHNVSSLIAQGSEFPLRKPAGFHWDFFLLGVNSIITGIIGVPLAYAHIPQSPFHTVSLSVTKDIATYADIDTGRQASQRIVERVVEQRVSNLAQGLLILGTMTGPILHALKLIPQGVLAGLLFIMAFQALQDNGLVQKIIFLAQDHRLRSARSPFWRVTRRRAVWGFVGIQIVAFGCILAVTQTVAAVAVPVLIMSLVPMRTVLLPMVFTLEELRVLDVATASLFTMESVGGG
ncbi:hypothetical protein FE257_010217 [Aspergillus nanangensis]|uniref:Bicarbonate transporter-like transmembrane domain-containing protein n=1 Tax=Aspergillus nanangensis TaxID=2582783 RepID=A0AAD4CJD3_ASPNN|nr:hypothetical protein FE257_010217 [Aspergillus nanangensis]